MRRAFSLVEVMVTIVIVGAMAAVALPNISGAIARERAGANAVAIADAIQAARETARETVCKAQLTVSPSGLEVRSHKAIAPGTAVINTGPTSACNLERVQTFPTGTTGVAFTSFDFTHCTNTVMQINEDGTVFDATDRVKLPITLADGRRWLIEIWPGSGAVRLNRG